MGGSPKSPSTASGRGNQPAEGLPESNLDNNSSRKSAEITLTGSTLVDTNRLNFCAFARTR